MLVVETIAGVFPPRQVDQADLPGAARVAEYRAQGGVVVSDSVQLDRSTQPRPKIDPSRSELDGMLAENARQPQRQRLTLVRVNEELRNRGYDGSYDAVRRYAASLSQATRETSAAAYVPLSFDPGEA